MIIRLVKITFLSNIIYIPSLLLDDAVLLTLAETTISDLV